MKKLLKVLICSTFICSLVAYDISVQGVLRDVNNRAADDGLYSMQFKIYDASTGGDLLWNSSTMEVEIVNGVYSETIDIDENIANGANLWLEVVVDGDTMSRVKLHLSPYEQSIVAGESNVFPSAGNVGIGTTSPSEALDVNGNIGVSGTISANIINAGGYFYGDLYGNVSGNVTGNVTGYLYGNISGNAATVTNGLTTSATGSYYMNSNLYPCGNAGVCNKTLGHATVRWWSADIFSITSSYYHQASDRRLKSNITDISDGLSVLRQLKPQGYLKAMHLNPADNDNDDYRYEIGLIAQDIAQIPALSHSVTGGGQLENRSGEYVDVPYNLNYNSIFMYGIAAMKELDEKNSTLERKIETLENTIQSLENKINTILSKE